MKITEAFLSEVQAQFDFCHLYGITQDPSSLDYMFVMRFAPQGDLRRYLLQNFDKISLASKLVCGVVAFADRSHDVRLIVDIFDGLRPQTCHFAPPVYNDLLERCWIRDPSKRPSIKEILESIELWCFHRKQNDVMNNNSIEGHKLFRSHYMSKGGICVKNKFCIDTIHDENDRFGNEFDDTIRDQFVNSQNAGYIYILMKWRPNKPIHLEAVYTSRSFSYKSLQEEINIFLSQRKSNRKSNQSSIVMGNICTG
ncbi:unnamed protein product [Rhizophagus irregularis]|uniref:Serine-threonine/tyrosine-protein kinase catalytic domain-containing protein n=1 Tax=Rhizophagus irregularis TaxID=588596 RepID=A0A915ZP62_9GLOM|nr:unnamed protein product [Rhizophagus irregularis]